ncbi:hypothetical protein BDV93DRAFT_510489 [Ceratobasidium sp. AG-I]|nr:hypothetical protein BDV93DRAFT_510489 [Ceratobasidium sp. AG-I]
MVPEPKIPAEENKTDNPLLELALPAQTPMGHLPTIHSCACAQRPQEKDTIHGVMPPPPRSARIWDSNVPANMSSINSAFDSYTPLASNNPIRLVGSGSYARCQWEKYVQVIIPATYISSNWPVLARMRSVSVKLKLHLTAGLPIFRSVLPSVPESQLVLQCAPKNRPALQSTRDQKAGADLRNGAFGDYLRVSGVTGEFSVFAEIVGKNHLSSGVAICSGSYNGVTKRNPPANYGCTLQGLVGIDGQFKDVPLSGRGGAYSNCQRRPLGSDCNGSKSTQDQTMLKA